MRPRPAGLLALPEIAHWLAMPTDYGCQAVRRLLKRKGIEPTVRGQRRVPSLWAWSDLQQLTHLIPRPDWDRDEAAA